MRSGKGKRSVTECAPVAACSHAGDAAAWAAGGLDPAASAAFEAHRRQCPICMAETETWCRLVERLRARPQDEPSANLTARIMAALPARGAHGRPSWAACATIFAAARRMTSVRIAAAAAVLLTALGVWAVTGRTTNRQLALRDGCAWLAGHQEPDGSWDPAKAGGAALYRPALTALATLALARAPERYPREIAAGCAALMRQQQPDGGIGPENAARMYNHALAVLTLLAVQRTGGHPELQPVIQRALAFICARQQPGGGWSYQPRAGGESANTAVTAWQVQVLACGRAQGWSDADGNLRKGLLWLQRRADGSGRFGYTPAGVGEQQGSATLDAMGAYTLLSAGGAFPQLATVAASTLTRLRTETQPQAAAGDFYRAFFTTAAWDVAGERGLARLVRRALCDRRETQGVNKGSWMPSDAWSAVGGRLYATSLAVLTIQPQQSRGAM